MPSAIRTDEPPLGFTFKNLGPVRNAELELGDLTVVAGRNNTGKTYLVYTLYGFLKAWEHLPGPSLLRPRPPSSAPPRRAARYPVFEEVSQQVAESGQVELSVDRDALTRERTEALNYLTRTFSKGGLADVFSSPPERFENASIGVKLAPEFPRHVPLDQASSDPEDVPPIRYDGKRLSVVSDGTRRRRLHPMTLRRRVWNRYLHFLLPELPSDPFVISAERFGVSLFYKDLDFRKSQIVDLLQKYGDKEDKDHDFPFIVLEETVSRYARPIKDNIDYTRSIPDRRRDRSEVYNDGYFNDIKTLMNGYYAASGDAIEFRSVTRGDRRFAIPLHLASSSARGLSDLYFFLRHVARKNHLLIIDEPESHLDTANQILMARLLARLTQAGLRVLLTTHSDYLIKELNNLIMLSSSFANRDKVARRLKYARDECIAPEQIRAYVAADSSITKCSIDRFGIDMPNFDDTIHTINGAANELSSRLAAEGSD